MDLPLRSNVCSLRSSCYPCIPVPLSLLLDSAAIYAQISLPQEIVNYAICRCSFMRISPVMFQLHAGTTVQKSQNDFASVVARDAENLFSRQISCRLETGNVGLRSCSCILMRLFALCASLSFHCCLSFSDCPWNTGCAGVAT